MSIKDALRGIDAATEKLLAAIEAGESVSEPVQQSIAARGKQILELAAAYHIGTPVFINEGVIYGRDAEVATWVHQHLGSGAVPADLIAFGVLRDGAGSDPLNVDIQRDLVAGAYFYNWYDADSDADVSDMMVAAACTDTLSAVRRGSFQWILDYPFGQRGVRRLTAEIDAGNARAINQAVALGFVETGKKPRMGPGGCDVLIFSLYPEVAQAKGFWKPSTVQAA